MQGRYHGLGGRMEYVGLLRALPEGMPRNRNLRNIEG